VDLIEYYVQTVLFCIVPSSRAKRGIHCDGKVEPHDLSLTDQVGRLFAGGAAGTVP
jgi:hypothetical protein